MGLIKSSGGISGNVVGDADATSLSTGRTSNDISAGKPSGNCKSPAGVKAGGVTLCEPSLALPASSILGTIVCGVHLSRCLIGPKPLLLSASGCICVAHLHSSLSLTQRLHCGLVSSHLTFLVRHVKQPRHLGQRGTTSGGAGEGPHRF